MRGQERIQRKKSCQEKKNKRAKEEVGNLKRYSGNGLKEINKICNINLKQGHISQYNLPVEQAYMKRMPQVTLSGHQNDTEYLLPTGLKDLMYI